MISKMRLNWARLPMLVAAASVASMLAAAAQAPSADDDPDMEAAEETEAAPETVDIMKDIDVSKLDWTLLNVDASTLPAPAPKGSGASHSAGSIATAWSGNERGNGTSSVSVKQSISPFWDTRIGADMTVARQGAATTSEQLSDKLANGGTLPQSSGTAWAAITAPGVGSIWDQTAVEARVDPGSEQSRIGTSLSKSLPIGEQTSLTLKNDYNLIQQGFVPVPGIVIHPTRSQETDQSARLNFTDTGTSLIAGQTSSASDDKWLRKVGAEQKLFGGVTISGAIGETPSGAASKSLSAGFKRSW